MDLLHLVIMTGGGGACNPGVLLAPLTGAGLLAAECSVEQGGGLPCTLCGVFPAHWLVGPVMLPLEKGPWAWVLEGQMNLKEEPGGSIWDEGSLETQ